MPGKKCDHPKRKLNTNLTKIIQGLSNLKDMNVSYHLALHMNGKDQTFGTENSSKVFEEHKAEFHDALVLDALDLCAARVDEDVQEKTKEDDLKVVAKERLHLLKHGSGLQKPTYPLKLINRKEKIAYIRYVLAFDRRERLGETSDRIVGGEKSFEPRFWPKDTKKWSELSVNLCHLKSEHLDGETPTGFFKKIIKAALDMFEK